MLVTRRSFEQATFKTCKIVWTVSFLIISGVSPALRQDAGLLWFSLFCQHRKAARICKDLHEKNGQRNWGPPRLHNAKVRFDNYVMWCLLNIRKLNLKVKAKYSMLYFRWVLSYVLIIGSYLTFLLCLLTSQTAIFLIQFQHDSNLSIFSMIAEIGGYSGLLLGFSLIDMVIVFEYLALFSKQAFNFFVKMNRV